MLLLLSASTKSFKKQVVDTSLSKKPGAHKLNKLL